ncbi:ABC transporter permease subunit, partial [Streptomyces olivaceus]
MSSDTLAKSAAVPETPDGPDLPRIVPQRRLGQWTAAAAVLVLLGLAVNSVLRNNAFQWGVVADYFTSDAVLRGLWLTLWLTAVVMVLGFALGTLLAAFRLSANPVLRAVSWGYVWLFRSIPILVQLLLWFNIGALYPQILGVKTVDLLGPVTVAVIGLTLHEAAYAAEVVRG